MISLNEIIQNFHANILGQSSAIQEDIIGSSVAFKQTRLGIYQNGYVLRLLEILLKDFPVLEMLMGQDLFDTVGRDYIRAHPSHHFSVRYFGQYFSKFLSSHPLAAPIHEEMAAFEWELEQAIDAKDAPQLTFEEMATLNPEDWANVKLTVHPSLQIVPFFYPTPILWQSLQQNHEKPIIEKQEMPTFWLMWRFDRRSYFRPLTEDQHRMIMAIQTGDVFSEVCEKMCEWLSEDRVVSFAAETLRHWINEGIFSAFIVAK